MQRFALALIVGLLSFSASGVSSVIISEPCAAYELPGNDDGACPPTCVTCGCCAQAAEPVMLVVASSPELTVANITVVPPAIAPTDPHDILHVPKPLLS